MRGDGAVGRLGKVAGRPRADGPISQCSRGRRGGWKMRSWKIPGS